MFDYFDPFKPSTWRRYLRFYGLVVKWLTLWLAASAELCLHRNIGRRYLPRLIMAVILYAFYASLAPSPSFFARLFLLIQFALLVYHVVQLATCRWRSTGEPYTLSAGDSWLMGKSTRITQETFQRYIEPGICLFMGVLFIGLDPFLYVWFEAAGIALFTKEQIRRAQLNRRILDSLDAKHEAQLLNTSLKAHQRTPNQPTQHTHRAHLPGPGGRRRP